MNLLSIRTPTLPGGTTFGKIYIDGQPQCRSLEDAIREIAGVPVAQWKVKHETCIPSGIYDVELHDSPRFGPGTITIMNVEGFDLIRCHSGEDKDDTDGCVVVGDIVDEEKETIHGGKAHGVLDRLKARVTAAILRGESVTWEFRNPEAA